MHAVLERYKATGTPGSGSRTGRPRMLSEAQNVNIVLTALEDKFTSPRQIVRKLDLGDVSRRTVDRRLQEAGLFGRVARHKRHYTEAEVRMRLSFAEGYSHWDKDDWARVLYSDEKIFWGKGFNGQTWVRRPIGEAFNPEYCVDKRSHPVKVNAWGCFCASGVGYLYIFNEKLNAVLERKILSDNVLPSAKMTGLLTDPPEQWYFLHDNDKKFTADVVQNWVHNNGVTAIDFPPYSPDLNPIENLWNTCAREVEKFQCETMMELQDVVADVWERIDVDHLRELSDSMPRRCQAVIAAHGWHTKY